MNNQHDPTTTIYLVGCVSAKLLGQHQARILYASDWFWKARAYVEGTGSPWYILSALHGLLHPEQVISEYNQSLLAMPIADRRAWASRVLSELEPHLHGITRVVVLAGARYREFLIEPLQARGITVEIPMAGLGIGQQLHWLKQAIRTRRHMAA